MTQAPLLKTQQMQVNGMDCGSCAKTIEAGVQQLPGVAETTVNFATGRLIVTYEPKQISENAIRERITALGYTVESSSTKTFHAEIGGMDCGSCAKTIEAALHQLPGVTEASIIFATGQLNVTYDPQQANETIIGDRIKALGYTIETPAHVHPSLEQSDVEHTAPPNHAAPAGLDFWLRSRRGQSVLLAGAGILLGLVAQLVGSPPWLPPAFYGIGIAVAGYPIARAGLFELRLRRADMNLLMTISVVGAVILGEWFEAALVVFLFSFGTTLQSFSFGRTRNAIRALMNLAPPTATVRRDGNEVTVPVESVGIGDIITIRPGQRVALDGVVVSGHSAIDQSPITGESIPQDKAPGDSVFAGTLNQGGFLEVQVTHTANDTTVANIIHLVEAAQSSRAPTQQWVDRFASIYTPLVILVAIAIATIPPVAFAQPFAVWFYRALVMLVIACPCALVISTPVSIVSAIGAATRHGVLFKGGNALETAGRLTTLAFDKTGTITQGLPTLQTVHTFGNISANMVLMIAASLEQRSEHPFAKAIVAQATAQGMELEPPEHFTAIPGKGIAAAFGNANYLVGNRRLFAEHHIAISDDAELLITQIEAQGQTPVLIGTSNGLIGAIALADGIRLEAAEAVRSLKRIGVKRLVMLTGDRDAVAQQIAKQVEVSEYRAELLPEDKLQQIQALRQSGAVGMVGDGINDAPALAAADISFAVGGIDIALETADVVLVGNDLRKLAYSVTLSRRTIAIIQQNVLISLLTKGLFLLLGTTGIVGLVVAVLADTGTSLLVTANGMRLFRD